MMFHSLMGNQFADSNKMSFDLSRHFIANKFELIFMKIVAIKYE